MTAAPAATTPLRVMIVDDEAPAREGLRLRLRGEPGVLVVGEYGDAAAALGALRADPPDVLFLDVEMPGLDGFALLERAGDAPLPVVFVTAHESYAVRAFAARALDYLLKPVEQERLRDALARARARLAGERREEVVDRVRAWLAAVDGGDAAIPAARRPARIPIRREGAIQFLDSDDVDYIDAAGDGVILHVGPAAHRANRTMGEIAALLDPARFVRIHRSTIVNIDRVRELQPWFHGEYVVVLRDGRQLKLSRGQRAEVMRLLGVRER
jgi:two-component system LytT family response regulator